MTPPPIILNLPTPMSRSMNLLTSPCKGEDNEHPAPPPIILNLPTPMSRSMNLLTSPCKGEDNEHPHPHYS